MRECTEAVFLKDVSTHKMHVRLDNGIFRCIDFRQDKDGWLQHFMLSTWPGYLCINGDMGCYVFSRIEDMFAFFRTTPDQSKKLYINPSYWGEKCEAIDRNGGREAFDEDKFRAAVGQQFKEHRFMSKRDKRECWEQIKDEVLRAEGEHDCYQRVAEFRFKGELDRFEFTDFWEHKLTSYTFRYIWCLYAIAWGIRQYDVAKTPEIAKAAFAS